MQMIERDSRDMFICGTKEDNVENSTKKNHAKNELTCEHHTELGNEERITQDILERMPKWHSAENDMVLMGSFHSLNFIFVFNGLCEGAIEGGIRVAKMHDGF